MVNELIKIIQVKTQLDNYLTHMFLKNHQKVIMI
jgi:hypothetical protein